MMNSSRLMCDREKLRDHHLGLACRVAIAGFLLVHAQLLVWAELCLAAAMFLFLTSIYAGAFASLPKKGFSEVMSRVAVAVLFSACFAGTEMLQDRVVMVLFIGPAVVAGAATVYFWHRRVRKTRSELDHRVEMLANANGGKNPSSPS